MKIRNILPLTALIALSCTATAAFSHHSFAVYYDSKTIITVAGVAKLFRFTNPHGILELEVKSEGKVQNWTIETTAPVFMQRRGWNRNSIKPGDHLIVEGWPAKDGSHLMRIRRVLLPDGTELGQSIPSTATGE